LPHGALLIARDVVISKKVIWGLRFAQQLAADWRGTQKEHQRDDRPDDDRAPRQGGELLVDEVSTSVLLQHKPASCFSTGHLLVDPTSVGKWNHPIEHKRLEGALVEKRIADINAIRRGRRSLASHPVT